MYKAKETFAKTNRFTSFGSLLKSHNPIFKHLCWKKIKITLWKFLALLEQHQGVQKLKVASCPPPTLTLGKKPRHLEITIKGDR